VHPVKSSDARFALLAPLGLLLFYFAFIGAFSPYFGLYLQSLNFSAWDIGLLMSQMQLMRLFGPNLWGWLADRFGRRMAIIRLAALIGLPDSRFFLARQIARHVGCDGVLAFFWSAALPLVETLTFDHLREERGRYSRIRLWGSIGFIVAVMLTGALLDIAPAGGVLWVCWGFWSGFCGGAGGARAPLRHAA
jgi:PPP family 3-phenylpropionic acid transporter